VVLFAVTFSVASAQSLKVVHGSDVPCPVCKASEKVEKSFIPPPTRFLLKSAEAKSDFIVDYVDFPDEAKTAFEYAISIWESIIESEMPIRVRAQWSSELGTNTLASCGPETYYADFKDAPYEGRYYAVAIAEKIANEELNGASRYDIEANFSSTINWYYGTDGNTPTFNYDFVSVVLHEIAHGLGFTGFFFVDEDSDVGAYGFYNYGDATPFDVLVENDEGHDLVDPSFFENVSAEMKSELESGYLYSNSIVAKSANSGVRPRLYAPSSFDAGSSVYHLNDYTYPAGNENSLMTHATGKGEAIHDPGPLTMGIMEDMGWTNLILRHTAVKDQEQLDSLVFAVTVDTYYPLNEDSAYVFYSTDNFETNTDTLLLESTGTEDEYSVTLFPEAGTEDLQYYIWVADEKGRVRTYPADAPEEVQNIHFGEDLEAPTVEATEIPYYLLPGEPLEIEASVDDNLGVDTVYVTYSINGVEQPEFALTLESGTNYTGYFNFDVAAVQDGDIIRYNIVAIDASSNENTTVYPEGDAFQCAIEEIFDPVSTYTNDFNAESVDFLLADFDIYTADNFTDGALHSPHPYENTGVDNQDMSVSTFLKYPIIIQENGSLSFDEVVLVEPGEESAAYGDDDFWDYVIVEGSADLGKTWYPLADGYDSGDNDTWKEAYNDGILLGGQDSGTEGTAEWYVTRQLTLDESEYFSAGDTVLIRFRLYSDPYATGWGWVIDNLSIQVPVSAPFTTLSPGNVAVYPNPFSDQIRVEIEAQKQLNEIRVELFDVYGRSLLVETRQNVSAFNESFNLQNYSSGLYLLKVSENGKAVLSRKLMKK